MNIKFRGVKIETKGEWVYGGYFCNTDEDELKHFIFTNTDGAVEVYENTIGQFTGLQAKNKIEIYQGDIVDSGKGEIVWCELNAMFKVKWHGEIFKRVRGQSDRYTLNGEPLFMNSHIAWEVIGNIHNNPELLTN
jgi:uncharacterized phage protein (TIGR01671 family)